MEIWKETRLKYSNFIMDILRWGTIWQDTSEIGHFMADRRELVDDEHAQFINKKRQINDRKSIKYILEEKRGNVNNTFFISGVALGSYLYSNVVKSSYTIMFGINSTLLALAILYSLVRLKWQTLPQQQPLAGTNLLTDYFDKKHVMATVRTMTKNRPNHGKLHLWFLLVIMMLYTFQRDEKPMSFLYTQLKFKWDVRKFSNFRTFQSATFVIGQLR